MGLNRVQRRTAQTEREDYSQRQRFLAVDTSQLDVDFTRHCAPPFAPHVSTTLRITVAETPYVP
ncbi:MAG: hypothetical protein ACJAYU_003707 [Bradymonadia bacterium]